MIQSAALTCAVEPPKAAKASTVRSVALFIDQSSFPFKSRRNQFGSRRSLLDRRFWPRLYELDDVSHFHELARNIIWNCDCKYPFRSNHDVDQVETLNLIDVSRVQRHLFQSHAHMFCDQLAKRLLDVGRRHNSESSLDFVTFQFRNPILKRV
jgi:hypothetical protein